MDVLSLRTFCLASSSTLAGNSVGSEYFQSLVSLVDDARWVCLSRQLLASRHIDTMALRRTHRLLIALRNRSGWYQAWRIAKYRQAGLSEDLKFVQRRLQIESSDSVWLTASTPELILLGRTLVEIGVKVYLTVWDDPKYIFQTLFLPSRVQSSLLDEFDSLLRGAHGVSVMSEGMRLRYAVTTRRAPTLLQGVVHGVSERTSPRSSNHLRIVFAGSLYAKSEWNAFVRALSHAKWQLSGRSVELIHIGHFPSSGAVSVPNVRRLGHLSRIETSRQLQEGDVAYLPYWLDEKHREPASLAFPGKLITYISAGLRVFHHGPQYAEASRVLKELGPYGITCNSLATSDILAALTSLCSETKTNYSRPPALEPDSVRRHFLGFLDLASASQTDTTRGT